MPDPGVYKYVKDMLEDRFEEKTDTFLEHWLPLGIVGTMDWVFISGWWLMRNTGIFEVNDQYDFLYSFNGYEFDPDQLFVFRDHPDLNKFEERFTNPGINRDERSEVVQWLFNDVYARWGVTPPPQDVVEKTVYATFMWILSDYGRDWIRTLDPIFHCLYDFAVAYLSAWDNMLLDPREVVCTERPINTCADCGHKMWCSTQGYTMFDDNNAIVFQYLCNHCAVLRAQQGRQADERDERLQNPFCPTCTYTKCPHLNMTEEDVWDQMREKGARRVADYREKVDQLGGQTPRQISGQTVEDIVTHFFS